MLRPGEERGHALIEALFIGLVLLVPLIWLLSVSSELHGAALGTSSAAREAGFEATRSLDPITADRRIASVINETIAAHGLDPSRVEVTWAPAEGWRRGGFIEVVVSYRVSVFQMPLLGSVSEPDIVVSGRHVTAIDRYRSRG